MTVMEAGAEAPARNPKVTWPQLFERFGLVLALIGIIVVFGVLEPDTFLTSANMSSILGSQAVLLILALGLIVPLTAGDYDLSVAGTLSLSAMMIAQLNAIQGWPILLAILAALAAGVLIGFINGFFVVACRVDALIVTLGTGTILQGIVVWISGSATVSGVSDSLVNAVFGDLFGIPRGFFYGLALCILLWYVFEYTSLGRRLLFVGGSRRVSRLSGLSVGRLRWGALVTSGAIAALAGVIYAGTTGGADSTSGATFLLPAFAAAFLGATAIVPDRFNPWGTLLAVYFLVTGITGLTILGAESYVQQLFYGGALVFAVAVPRIVKKPSGD
jgi:ribose transport system permease protein